VDRSNGAVASERCHAGAEGTASAPVRVLASDGPAKRDNAKQAVALSNFLRSMSIRPSPSVRKLGRKLKSLGGTCPGRPDGRDGRGPGVITSSVEGVRGLRAWPACHVGDAGRAHLRTDPEVLRLRAQASGVIRHIPGLPGVQPSIGGIAIHNFGPLISARGPSLSHMSHSVSSHMTRHGKD
jgi:hypothetical protein